MADAKPNTHTQPSLTQLLQEDEERVRQTLRSDCLVDKSRDGCVRTLQTELSNILLKYNASCGDDPRRQALADALVAPARDSLDLLYSPRAEVEAGKRHVASRAVYTLLICVGVLVAVLLTQRLSLVGCAITALAFAAAWISGRAWFVREESTVQAVIDPDRAYQALQKTVETMDRKIEDCLARLPVLRHAPRPALSGEKLPMDLEQLQLFSDLLEPLYAHNGDFALRQLEKIPRYLEDQGLSLPSYSEETAAYFELFPSKRESQTMRPAILQNGKLLLMGKATEQIDH